MRQGLQTFLATGRSSDRCSNFEMESLTQNFICKNILLEFRKIQYFMHKQNRDIFREHFKNAENNYDLFDNNM